MELGSVAADSLSGQVGWPGQPRPLEGICYENRWMFWTMFYHPFCSTLLVACHTIPCYTVVKPAQHTKFCSFPSGTTWHLETNASAQNSLLLIVMVRSLLGSQQLMFRVQAAGKQVSAQDQVNDCQIARRLSPFLAFAAVFLLGLDPGGQTSDAAQGLRSC